VTDKRRPDDEDDEQKTAAGDASTPGAGGTQGDFGLDDLESLPGKRPTPAPKTPAPPPKPAPGRTLPALDESFDAPAATSPAGFDATMPPPAAPASPQATIADSAAVPRERSAEAPTREMDVERELPTIVGAFAASQPPRPPSSEDMETIAEAEEPSELPTSPDLASKSGPPSKSATPFVSPLSKAASRTARDPIVGSAASRASQPGAAHVGPHALAEGQLLADRYELIERLGKGGMGEVWKAKHILLQGHRAIKVIKASISRDATFRQRFLQEGQTMMRVKHPGVVEVTDLDETRQNRELFMVMEYLRGRTIYDAVRDKQKPLSGDVRAAVRILIEVADGMQRIHDERIVHKDLKSDNVLLVADEKGVEHPKVIDFGLAKRLGDTDVAVEPGPQTSPGPGYDPDLRTTLSGTLAYMAPEQFRNQPSSFQSDIYAFGVMAYEVFSNGEFPLPRGSLVEYMKLHEAGKAPDVLAAKRPDLDRRLTAIFDGCIAMKREARPESFTKVRDDLQYWLDTPEREAKKRKKIYMVSGAAALVAFAAWAYFFGGEKTATLSNLTVAGGGTSYSLAGGKTLHLPAAALSAFEIRATIGGKPGVADLEIDDRSHEVKADVSDGRFVARADLSSLPDGEHRVAIKPSSGAVANEFVIDVDRAPPKVRGASVQGAVTTGKGVFTNSDAPVVVVELDEPASGIAEVYALAADRMKSPGELEKGSENRYLIKGTATGDGKVECDVVVHDLAGNEALRHVAYVRDTKKPETTIRDYFTCTGYDKHPSRLGAWVRRATGAKLVATIGEAAHVEATFGQSPPVVCELAAAGEAALDMPPVPGAGFEAKLTVRDVAGNETKMEIHVGVELDGFFVMDVNTNQALTVKADDPSQNPIVIVARPYPIGDGLELWATRLRGPDAAVVEGEAPRRAKLRFVRPTDEGKTHVYAITPGTFEDGVYKLDAKISDDLPTQPLTLTVDSAPPVVESVTVEDAATGQPIKDWALAPDIVVRVVASDLSLQRVDLEGTKPAEPVKRGRSTYAFRMHLDHEGDTTWTLALADAAGHTAEKAITVRGDWTPPEITALDAPRDGAAFDDRKPVVFAGRCSESTYRLMIEGLSGDTALAANCVAQDFRQEFQLPATEGPVAVRVVAVDPAGHRSAPKILSLSVKHVRTERAAEITWTRGVDVQMEKVEQGDVVLAACAAPVTEVFIDKTEVTNAQYRAFLAAAKDGDAAWRHKEQPANWSHVPSAATWNDPKWNADDFPVVNVAYWDAYAFAKWTGRRLPTEAEWVKAAAKKTGETNLRQWPSFCEGSDWKDGVLATSESVKGPVSALKSDDVSPCGCLHMGGNVSEWVDLAAASGEGGSSAGTRGGNWYFTKRAADVRNTPGKTWDRSFRERTIGFRCAVDADQVQQ
jgi:formylglycine-generating enzyme required for sulfatase activity/tRNA A-37 threonylcarbamoyl transferase component Bud32